MNILVSKETSRYTITCEDINRTIITSLNKHIDHTDMQKEGCRALRNFIDQENRSTIARLGGVKSIINAMNRHSTHKDVQIQGCALEETLYQV